MTVRTIKKECKDAQCVCQLLWVSRGEGDQMQTINVIKDKKNKQQHRWQKACYSRKKQMGFQELLQTVGLRFFSLTSEEETTLSAAI